MLTQKEALSKKIAANKVVTVETTNKNGVKKPGIYRAGEREVLLWSIWLIKYRSTVELFP